MGDWRGEDGQWYDTYDQARGATNRYRQQQEQNELIKKNNDLLEQSMKVATEENRKLQDKINDMERERKFEKEREERERKLKEELQREQEDIENREHLGEAIITFYNDVKSRQKELKILQKDINKKIEGYKNVIKELEGNSKDIETTIDNAKELLIDIDYDFAMEFFGNHDLTLQEIKIMVKNKKSKLEDEIISINKQIPYQNLREFILKSSYFDFDTFSKYGPEGFDEDIDYEKIYKDYEKAEKEYCKQKKQEKANEEKINPLKLKIKDYQKEISKIEAEIERDKEKAKKEEKMQKEKQEKEILKRNHRKLTAYFSTVFIVDIFITVLFSVVCYQYIIALPFLAIALISMEVMIYFKKINSIAVESKNIIKKQSNNIEKNEEEEVVYIGLDDDIDLDSLPEAQAKLYKKKKDLEEKIKRLKEEINIIRYGEKTVDLFKSDDDENEYKLPKVKEVGEIRQAILWAGIELD